MAPQDSGYMTFMDFPDALGAVVPQRVYRASSPVAHRPIIMFNQDNHQGMYLRDALLQRISGLDDMNSRPEMTTSSRITLRIGWTGYQDFSYPVSAREQSQAADSIPKWKLAMSIAQAVRTFYQNAIPLGPESERAGWNLENIEFDKLLLLGLIHVSTSSWQPVLSYDYGGTDVSL